MPYRMIFRVDGGCRRNGKPGCYGAAAATLDSRSGKTYRHKTRRLPAHDYDTPTNQRAEITAIIIALEWALGKYEELYTFPHLDVTIYTDSKYALGCMTDWIHNWRCHGWINAKGYSVANRDLIEEASNLDNRVNRVGEIRYVWVPRAQNANADKCCNDEMDEMEQDGDADYY